MRGLRAPARRFARAGSRLWQTGAWGEGVADAREVRLREGKRAAIVRGRPWVYRGEIARIQGDPATGDVITLVDPQGAFLGRGFYHRESLLAVRLLTRRPDEAIDDAFFSTRLQAAWALRRRLIADPRVCRVVFAEADGIPGLIADRYDTTLVVQTLVAGVDARLPLLVAELAALTGVRGVWERNEGPVRRLEGLPERTGPVWGEPPDQVEIQEGLVRLRVNLRTGQKTGHFLDQRANHAAFGATVGRLLVAEGAGEPVRVLDAFCHTGGFGLAALAAGADMVAFVDSAAAAVEAAIANAERNGWAGRSQGIAVNAFDHLRVLARAGERFAAVVLDPPAFAHGRAQLDAAYRGYKEINLRALRLLAPGGLLCTCSCSQPVSVEMFLAMLADAAADAGRRVRVLGLRGAPPDHPGLLGAGETQYLKCVFAQAVD